MEKSGESKNALVRLHGVEEHGGMENEMMSELAMKQSNEKSRRKRKYVKLER